MKKLFAVLVLVLLLVGCGMTPKVENYEIAKELTYSEDIDSVWIAVIGVFAELSIPVSTVEKDSGLICSNTVGVERSWMQAPKDTSDFRIIDAYGTFNVWVRPVDSGVSVTVSTNFIARVSRFNLLTGFWRDEESFVSSGVFERKFHQLLHERLQ